MALPPIPPPLLPQTYDNATNLPPLATIHHRLLAPVTGATATASFSVFLFLVLFCHRLFRRRPPPSSDNHTESLRRFSYSSLRRATSCFASSRRLGQGGFGAVYSGTLSDKKLKNLDVAVKVMDSGSLQGEREFHNEILMANKLCNSDYVVSLLGFASDRRRRRMCLVYELMTNGNLQECLLHRKCQELMSWAPRRQIVIEVAKGLAYLHHQCDPPIIHGDVKPSNVLLDDNFSAKIGDFGLARLKLVDPSEFSINCGEDELKSLKNGNTKDELRIHVEDTGSVVETESVITLGLEEASTCVDLSPENFVRVPVVETSPEMFSAVASPSDLLEIIEEPKPAKVKDYVMEWIGSEIDKERSAGNWMAAPSTSTAAVVKPEQKKKSKDKKHRLDWWMAMDDDVNLKKTKRRPIREWWKDEYSEEVAKKSKKKRKKKIKQQGETNDDYHNEDNWWPRDDEMMYVDSKMKSKRRKNSRGNLEWWLDGLSGDLWKGRHISCDSMSGDIPKSGGISSTPSMRGTVCYIAPEYSSGGDLSEKCDVYSFGVLLLVVVAGRRPLQVSGSPMSEYQSANLLSWARKLARTGKLLDLVDKKIEPLNAEEALVCIKVALLCLQKSPAKRPTMNAVVGILTGELDPPCLPPELSPSRPSRFPYKSHKKIPAR